MLRATCVFLVVSTGITKSFCWEMRLFTRLKTCVLRNIRLQHSHVARSNEGYAHMTTSYCLFLIFMLRLHELALKRRTCFVRQVCEVAFFSCTVTWSRHSRCRHTHMKLFIPLHRHPSYSSNLSVTPLLSILFSPSLLSAHVIARQGTELYWKTQRLTVFLLPPSSQTSSTTATSCCFLFFFTLLVFFLFLSY